MVVVVGAPAGEGLSEGEGLSDGGAGGPSELGGDSELLKQSDGDAALHPLSAWRNGV